jgi:hypothetical protein
MLWREIPENDRPELSGSAGKDFPEDVIQRVTGEGKTPGKALFTCLTLGQEETMRLETEQGEGCKAKLKNLQGPDHLDPWKL